MSTSEMVEWATLADLTADALIARAHEMLAQGDKLIAQAKQLRAVTKTEATPPAALAVVPEPEVSFAPIEVEMERSVGRLGVVTMEVAIDVAASLRYFDRAAFEEALGLKGPRANHWLMKLVNSHRVEREETDNGPMYRFIKLDQPRVHETKAPPEKHRPSYELAQATGMPVRIRTERSDRRGRSTPGQRHKIIQRDRAYDLQQAAKLERAVAQREAAKKAPPPGRKVKKASRPVT